VTEVTSARLTPAACSSLMLFGVLETNTAGILQYCWKKVELYFPLEEDPVTNGDI
jgi:hypothetical protein